MCLFRGETGKEETSCFLVETREKSVLVFSVPSMGQIIYPVC